MSRYDENTDLEHEIWAYYDRSYATETSLDSYFDSFSQTPLQLRNWCFGYLILYFYLTSMYFIPLQYTQNEWKYRFCMILSTHMSRRCYFKYWASNFYPRLKLKIIHSVYYWKTLYPKFQGFRVITCIYMNVWYCQYVVSFMLFISLNTRSITMKPPQWHFKYS